MSGLKLLGVPILTGVLSLTAALAFERVYYVRVQARPVTPIASLGRPARGGTAAATEPHAQELRLVDSAGIGIPLGGEWGQDYSHDRRFMREVILEDPPYVDEAAFERVALEWRSYVRRMLEYGNNAMVVPLLLELIDFDRVTLAGRSSGQAVYAADSPYRARHAAIRGHFAPLLEWTEQQGMRVFLEADMLSLTQPLARVLQDLAPARSAVGIDAADPAVWEVYRAGLEELFDRMPSVRGLVIRFGEGGSLYSTKGWPYRSEVAVRNAASLRAMLRGLLPVFEGRSRTLVLRSWTVGVGGLGRLHLDPGVYEEVLGDIDSPALVVSTKFTAGDFFSYLPLNPTLFGGRHRRLVELQAKPEFEGFGAFPDFLGHEHARALRVLTAANPRIIGTYVLPQFGGPLRAGPRTLYPLHGFWLWIDANVFVASRLALDPDDDVDRIAGVWARSRFSQNAEIVEAVTRALDETRRAVLQGFYIRPFAEREIRVPGLELPPLMWIFEWDRVGGWHSLLSIVYRGSRDAIDVAVAEGYAAAGVVRQARLRLLHAIEAAGPGACTQACDGAVRSLEYQESLFAALAAWRQAFLSYYRWLDSGDPGAWAAWQEGRARFVTAAERHVARFGHDLEFPAFDMTSAIGAAQAADRGGWTRTLSVALLIAAVAFAGMGSPLVVRSRTRGAPGWLLGCSRLTWTAAVTPWRLRREPLDLGTSLVVAMLPLSLAAVLALSLTNFADARIGVISCLGLGAIALTFESTATREEARSGRGRLLVASLAPLVPGLLIFIGAIAYFAPLGFWYRFWVSSAFRVCVLTLLLAMPLWTTSVMLTSRRAGDWRSSLGGWLAAAGAGLLVLVALLPDWVAVLRSLDRPLNLAPATDTMLFGLRTYAGVNLDAGYWPLAIGALMVAGGYALRLRSGFRARTSPGAQV
jgi:hypothetical protein